MKIPLITLVLATVGLAAEIHGPFVQWDRDPCRQASVRWIEPARKDGNEGAWSPGPFAARGFFSLFGMPETDNACRTNDFGGQLSFVLRDSGHSASISSHSQSGLGSPPPGRTTSTSLVSTKTVGPRWARKAMETPSTARSAGGAGSRLSPGWPRRSRR